MTSLFTPDSNSITLRAARSWGNEFLIVCQPSRFTVKILELFEGSQGGLQFHHFKFECGLVLEGLLRIDTEANEKITSIELKPNSFFVFPNGLIHREKAIERTLILEISTPHFNDRVRLDSDKENLLPSTDPKDVFEITSPAQLLQLERFGFLPVDSSCIPSISLLTYHHENKFFRCHPGECWLENLVIYQNYGW